MLCPALSLHVKDKKVIANQINSLDLLCTLTSHLKRKDKRDHVKICLPKTLHHKCKIYLDAKSN